MVADGKYYVYVKVAGRDDKFERRRVEIAQEKDDHVVIDGGLVVNEEVVCIGGLLLAQLYDDMEIPRNRGPARRRTQSRRAVSDAESRSALETGEDPKPASPTATRRP